MLVVEIPVDVDCGSVVVLVLVPDTLMVFVVTTFTNFTQVTTIGYNTGDTVGFVPGLHVNFLPLLPLVSSLLMSRPLILGT